MAKIVLSEQAPQGENITFSLPGAEPFEVPYETDSQIVLANAEAHPWLSVERDESEVIDPPSHFSGVDPTKDPLSAQYEGDTSEDAPEADPADPLAVDADRDQNKAETVGGEGEREVDVTLAGQDNDDKPRRTRRATKEN